jgi:zinc transporter ZupT
VPTVILSTSKLKLFSLLNLLTIAFFNSGVPSTAVYFSYLFAITILHLMPDVYESGNKYTGLFVLLGFSFQIILEQFSEGIEHGHIHTHQHQQKNIFPIGIMLSLCLHAFLEGMPLVGQSIGNNELNSLVFGIAIHHIPAAFALASVLLSHQVKGNKLIVMLAIFAFMTPAGSYLSQQIQLDTANNIHQYFPLMMATVIGIFLHISTTILFESNVDHRFNFYKMIAIIIGAGIAVVNFLLH